MKRFTATALILAACLCFSGCVNIYTDGGKGKNQGETPTPAPTAQPTAAASETDTGSAKAYEDYGTLRAASGGENIPRTQDYQISASSAKAPMAGISYVAENLKDNSLGGRRFRLWRGRAASHHTCPQYGNEGLPHSKRILQE